MKNVASKRRMTGVKYAKWFERGVLHEILKSNQADNSGMYASWYMKVTVNEKQVDIGDSYVRVQRLSLLCADHGTVTWDTEIWPTREDFLRWVGISNEFQQRLNW